MSATIIAGIIAVIAAVAFIWWSKSGKTPKEEANSKWGLPKDWDPTEYLGPADQVPVSRTPKGMAVNTGGFDNSDIPLLKDGVKARVILEDIDTIWDNVKTKMSSPSYVRLDPRTKRNVQLTATDRSLIAVVERTRASVKIWSTIQWSGLNNGYVAGLTLNNSQACAVVWYKSVKNNSIVNWEGILDWEFQNIVLIAIGRGELAY